MDADLLRHQATRWRTHNGCGGASPITPSAGHPKLFKSISILALYYVFSSLKLPNIAEHWPTNPVKKTAVFEQFGILQAHIIE